MLQPEEKKEKMKRKFNIPLIKPPTMNKCFPATLKLKNTENTNKSSNWMERIQDFPDQKNEVSEEIKLSLAQQLDRLMSKEYDFVEVAEISEAKTELEVKTVDHTISFYFLSSASQEVPLANRTRPKRRLQCEEVTYEDLRQVAVTGDWVLNKCGVYGKGRERLGELITDAEHSAKLKKKKKRKKKIRAVDSCEAVNAQLSSDV